MAGMLTFKIRKETINGLQQRIVLRYQLKDRSGLRGPQIRH
jgi:hypothetical protein